MTTEWAWRLERGDFAGVSTARHDFALYLRGKAADDDERYDAGLIFGELVGNAVKCARTSVSVELISNGWAALRVTDDGDCFDRSQIGPQPAGAESGRGLYIVDQLARDLTVDVSYRHCAVTAVLPIRG
jgi:anti-sigma regulatory factor (Ser/Thr protein kinase)